MELAKVIGQVVSTVRCPGLPYNSLLLVDLLNEKGESIGRSQVAADPIVDHVNAGKAAIYRKNQGE